jgi:DNA adenine methylase
VAVEKARDALDRVTPEWVEKTLWGSPAGKKRLAKRLVAMLPPHTTYVEPFCGSAAVLFAKEPSRVEVINDADVELAQAYRMVKRLSAADLEHLKRKNWVGDRATYKKLLDSKPSGLVDQIHRFLYVTHFSYGKMRGRSFSPNGQGVLARSVERVETFAPRLKNVRVYEGDYLRVVRKYDGPNTAFFLDPPYPGYDVAVGESKFDEERFFEVLKSLKGRFLMTYGIRGKLPGLLKGSKFHVKRIQTPRTIRSMRGVGGPKMLTQLLVTNYTPVAKQLVGLEADGWVVEDWGGPDEVGGFVPAAPGKPASGEPAPGSFSKPVPLIKGVDPEDERYVLGIVLEPEVVDAQGDIYSAEEIRQAAHRFMEEFGGLGLMHRMQVNGQVKILESYLAPVDFDLGGVRLRKGTWLLAVRILSDELWAQVKDGTLSGFSIGGSARKVPEQAPKPGAPQPDAPERATGAPAPAPETQEEAA